VSTASGSALEQLRVGREQREPLHRRLGDQNLGRGCRARGRSFDAKQGVEVTVGVVEVIRVVAESAG